MGDPEIYWKAVSFLCQLSLIIVGGYCFYGFVKPFLQKKKYAWCVGAAYSIIMLLLYVIPPAMDTFFANGIGILLGFAVMCLLEWRNLCQKIFLTVTFFLLRWISRGLAASVYIILSETIIHLPVFASAGLGCQFWVFVGVTVFNVSVTFLFIWMAIHLILRAYVYKNENMTGRELCLFLFPSLSILAGYYGFQFCETVFEAKTGKLLEDVYGSYLWIKNLYQAISFVAILALIVCFQNIKSRQREEKQAEFLFGQIEDMKGHIREVEKLYRDIRSLKHDMGNHVMTLENLCKRSEHQEAVQYVAKLREQFQDAVLEVKSGNPVTDVILMEKRKVAQEEGIDFQCEFHYPEKMGMNAFDVSIILSNALANGIEAARSCRNPYLSITSYLRKNVFMIEVKNSFDGVLVVDADSGLPITTKEDSKGHGFGLPNIRRVAQKYYGDIDIRQDKDSFLLSIMLMAEVQAD